MGLRCMFSVNGTVDVEYGGTWMLRSRKDS